METQTAKIRILGKICPFCLIKGKTVEAGLFIQIRASIVWECPACKRQFDNLKKEKETDSNKERPP